jgi:transketolase
MNELEKRIVDISYKRGLTHISSCLGAVNIINQIYEVMKPQDKFVLSQGHAFLALAVVLEKKFGLDAEKLSEEHGTHPNRNVKEGIWVSTGSLGQGIAIAVGMAIADKTRDVYVVSSDGEMAEGMAWEALRVAGEQRLENLRVTVIANGTGGYGKIDTEILDTRLQMFYPTLVVRVNMFAYPDFLQGVGGHYVKLDKEKYEELV